MGYFAAAIQFDCVPLKKEENLRALTQLIREAARQGAQLIVLPEMCTTGYYFFDQPAAEAVAEEIPSGETVRRFEALCAELNCYLVAGLMEREGGVLYNAAVLIGPEGFLGKHRKVHFFAPDGHWAQEGSEPVAVFKTPLGNLAMQICMDISFPESVRTAKVLGADVICGPVNWVDVVIPSSVWVTRAFENQLYMVVANRLGKEAGYVFSGGTCVIGPDGGVLDCVQEKTGIAYGEINLQKPPSCPRLPRRRPELYRELSLRRFNWPGNPIFHTFSRPAVSNGRAVSVGVSAFMPEGGTLEERQRELCGFLASRCAGTEFMVFPELALSGPDGALTVTEPAADLKGLTEYCVEHKVNLVVGGALKEREVYSAAFVIARTGEVFHYRKAHLGPGEQRRFAPGGRAGLVLDLDGIRLGVLLGHDLLMPEAMVLLANRCCDLVAVPAGLEGICRDMTGWKEPNPSWHLARNRANETNTWVAFANASGCSGIFSPDMYDPVLPERVGDRTAEPCRLELDLRAILTQAGSLPRENINRGKPMMTERVPRLYRPIYQEE